MDTLKIFKDLKDMLIDTGIELDGNMMHAHEVM
ncbi:hypothetical protein Arcve_0680 [Archaeoglobus veneficus SNP6]|uniref:Uncharacterized protein n=1 Tax=Archaeoglobus veneficus (strain DSM 11195 / SNP6) TaxID=693661 RepID=F2KR63_ARCVS|nr:hypothetical protein Arcve_0680 [Archaeoglobus veneficus SNP6]